MKNIFLSMREDKITSRSEMRDSIDQKLILWVKKVGLNPILISNKNSFNLFKNLSPVGVILSGGNDIKKKSSRYKLEKKLLIWALKEKKPVLGICHGMQLLIKYEKGRLCKVKNRVKKKIKIKTLEKKINYPEQVLCFYNYAIKNCPKNFYVTAKSLDNYIEAVRHKKNNWEGWMWHPEREKRFNYKLIKRARKIFKI